MFTVSRDTRMHVRRGRQWKRRGRAVAIRNDQHSHASRKRSRSWNIYECSSIRNAQGSRPCSKLPEPFKNGKCFAGDLLLFRIERHGIHDSAYRIHQMARWQIACASAVEECLSLACRQRLHDNLSIFKSIGGRFSECEKDSLTARKDLRLYGSLALIDSHERLRCASVGRNEKNASDLAKDNSFRTPADATHGPRTNRHGRPAIHGNYFDGIILGCKKSYRPAVR